MKIEPSVRRVMTTSEITARVNQLAPKFLEGLTPDDLAVVLEAATLRRFQAHTILTSEGDPADACVPDADDGARYYTISPRGKKLLFAGCRRETWWAASVARSRSSMW